MENNSRKIGQQEIKSFYNSFKKKQVVTGVNLRHYMVFNKCLQAGLTRNHHILEIGCGIGTFTQLVARYLKNGHVTATDISNESIDEARRRLGKHNKIKFLVSDMSDFPADTKFDFVVMVDVLEHIPFDQYHQLFGLIDKVTHPDSVLALNIPHPDMIRHLRKNQPEMLQVIDNPVDMDYLSGHIYKNNFRLAAYHPYSIHNENNDYVFMVLEKSNKPKAFRLIPKHTIIIRKIRFRLKYLKAVLFSS